MRPFGRLYRRAGARAAASQRTRGRASPGRVDKRRVEGDNDEKATAAAVELINLVEVRRRKLCKYSARKTAPGAHLILLAVVALAAAGAGAGARTVHAMLAPRRPDSSSSLFADVEDLTDSSVRTRLGTLNIEHLGNSPADFDRLIERIVAADEPPAPPPRRPFVEVSSPLVSSSLAQSQSQARPQAQTQLESRVPADANNRTSMRFFRNSKTFASIVYTNPLVDNQRQPRRLINCHLVDLEKHSSDVAIYEAKYDIRTIDIDFKEMMQLIEACTNIARLRRRPPNGIGQQPSAPGSQYRTAGGQQQAPAGDAGGPASSAFRPMVVVGRPAPMVARAQSAQPLASQQQAAGQTQARLAAALERAVAGALSRELHRTIEAGAPPATSAQGASEPPPQQEPFFTEQHNHLDGVNHERPSRRPRTRQHDHRARRRFDPYPAPDIYANYSNPQNLNLRRQLKRNSLARTLVQLGEESKKLVLGEVTPPPGPTTSGRNGAASGATSGSSSLREALQEISSYDTSDLLSIWRGILPGTNWCGMGDRASSYNDLGFESDIDICCRAHDFCPVRLSAFTSGYGLFNWSFYTRSHCWCDQNFLDCLQQAESPLSTVVMKFYFSIMKTTCLNDIETSVASGQQQQQQQQHAKQQKQQHGDKSNNRPKWSALFPAPAGKSAADVGRHQQAGPAGIRALKQSQWFQTKYETHANNSAH